MVSTRAWPLAIASLTLAVAELICERAQNAVFHIRGAHQILRNPCGLTAENHNSLVVLLQVIDLHIFAYALSYKPMSVLLAPAITDHSMSDLPSSRILLMQIQSMAASWGAAVLKSGYRSTEDHQSLSIEQGRHIASLLKWLEKFNSHMLPMTDSFSTIECMSMHNALEESLLLRMTCTSAIIHISTLLQDDESRFGAYACHFEQIVRDAENVLSLRRSLADIRETPIKLVTGLGMNSALCLTAGKYRNLPWRQRAIQCIRENGFELLFDGLRDSLIAERLLQLEEMQSVCSHIAAPSQSVLMRGYRILQDDASLNSNKVRVRWFREKQEIAVHCCGFITGRSNRRLSDNCDLEVWDEQILY